MTFRIGWPMSKLTSREYISRQGVGNPAQCETLKLSIGRQLRAWCVEKSIEGYVVVTLFDESDIIDEDLADFEIPRLTDGRLPVVWLNVTYRPPQYSPPERDAFETAHDLLLIRETESLD